MKLKGRTDLSFPEAASIIVGHGIGAGILSVPYLASRNSIRDIIIILIILFNSIKICQCLFIIFIIKLNSSFVDF